MFRKFTIFMLGLALLVSTGCSCGPIRRFFRGGACNACEPVLGGSLFRWGGSDDCPCSAGVTDGLAPSETILGGELLVPGPSGGSGGGTTSDPYSGSSTVTPVNPQNTEVLPRPR